MMVIIAHIVNILKTIELYIFFFLSNYLFLAVLGLHCCEASSSCGEWGLLFSCSAWLSHCSGFSRCRALVLGARASVAVVGRL